MLRPTPHARSLALLVTLSLLRPAAVAAAPAPSPELAAFEAGFTEGQAQYDRGEYLLAARTWIRAAEALPEKTLNRDNRVAVYEYAADAFVRGLAGSKDLVALREAVTALDTYCEGFTRAYGTETPIGTKITGPRDTLRRQLAELEAAQAKPAPPPVKPPPRPPPQPTKPWKGLAIGGGVLIGLGLGATALATVGAAQGLAFTTDFDDPADPATVCIVKQAKAGDGDCADLYARGKTSNAMGYAGLVTAPLLVGAGVALLVLGLKRRAAGRKVATRVVPTLAPGFAGLALRGRF